MDEQPHNWIDDPEQRKLIERIALEHYEAHKDNPYAAIGYANVIAALYGGKGTPIVPARKLTLWQCIRQWLRLSFR